MVNQPKLYLRVILVLSLIMGLSSFSFAQNKSGVKSITDYTSMAKISGTSTGKNITYTNPYSNQSSTTFAGTFKGTLNSEVKYFYCIDIGNYLATNEDYWDEGSTPSEITYILNNYYPYKTGYPGQTTSLEKEAAAIQLAIWHFSDGLNANTISNDADVKARALAIIADATANHNNVKPVETLLIVPPAASYVQGTPATFLVFAFDIDGNPVPNVTIQLTTTLGSLSASSVVTNASGKGGPITLTYSGLGSATIKAKADVVIPQGTRYVHKTSPNSKQKLVLATPAFDTKQVNGTVTWYTPAQCDLKGFTTYTQGGWGSPSNSGPGQIRDMYFDNVFPTGLVVGSIFKITLTTAQAVEDFLPQGGTAGALTQNYTNPTSTSAGVLAGQIVALKLNVNYDAAGYIGSNATPLGNLVIKSGPFTGYTVNQFLALAELALGGGSLSGFTFSEINDAATKINENFDNGTVDKGYLDCNENVKASIGDRVWEDLNKNGIQDNGEPGVSGVIVKLYDCSNNLIGTKTTDANGYYLFDNLVPGDYYVQFILPSGYIFTTKDAGSDDAKDSDTDLTTGKTICTTLTPGENDLTWDAGLIKEDCKNKIGDFVWHDEDTDGIQDANESGIPGVVVELLDSQNNVLLTTTTNASGYYEFNNILNGTYKVRIAASNFVTGGVLVGSQSEKWFLTFKDKGTNDAKDSDGDLTNRTASVTVNCNDDLTIDFGFFKVCVDLQKSGPTSINVGEKITYSFTVTNCGDILLSGGANVYDPMLMPAGDHKIKYLKLYPGQSETFTYEYTTDETDCGNLTNNAWVIGHPSLDNYNFGSNTVRYDDSHTVNVICQPKQADLEIKKTASKTPVQCDEAYYYTITVKNNGPDKSEGIVIYDLLPVGAIYQSYSASQGLYNSATGFWGVGDLNSGATATLTINVKADCDEVNNGTFDLGIAKDFNLFVIKDVNQPSSDTQGKAAIGGNASFANYSVGDQLPDNSGDVLIVGGHLQYSSGAVYNGNVVYGNTTNLPIPAVSVEGTIEQGNPIDFAAAEAYLLNLSATLSGYTTNGTTTMQWGGLNLTGTDPFLNVFSVNGSDLSNANNVSITVPNGSVVLVNINGTSITWTGGLTVNGTSIGNVLYNFYQATSITIQGIDIRGSVLAPKAHVNFVAGVINGQMICKSLEGMGQMNLAPFNGNIPYEKEVINNASIHSVITIDPNPNNNSASVKVVFSNTSTGGNNGNGNGNDWQQVNGFGSGEIVYSLIYNNGKIYAGTWGGKIYLSTNNGLNWTRINNNMTVGFIWALTASNGYIFAATEMGVYKYDGSTWTLTSLTGMDVHALTVNNGIIYAGTWGFGVYKSADNGSTWTPANNGLGYFTTVQSLTVKGTTLFCGTVGGGVFKSINGGANWTPVTVGNNMIWALGATSTAVFASSYGDGLYRSLDNGSTWTKLDINVQFIYSIAVDGSGKIYVASWASGVFESSDNGNTWTSLGMGGFGVSSVMVSPNDDAVMVGTKDGKIYLSKGQGLTSVGDNNELPTTIELSQNYPNPFNPTTTIQFALPEAGKFNLKVYNILGQEVVTLMDGEMNAGIHKVNFDASKLASGVYVYRLVGNNVNISKKMILMK